jgi:hypothetical protein
MIIGFGFPSFPGQRVGCKSPALENEHLKAHAAFAKL